MTQTPEVGQIWADNDERTRGSGEFTITAIVPTGSGPKACVERESGRRTRIRLDRFKDTSKRGYRYIGKAR